MFDEIREGVPDDILKALGPGAVDRQIREAIHLCWLMLEPGQRNIVNLETEMNRLLNRAIRDIKEDDQRQRGSN